MQLEKNTVLITGGTSGIGFELAQRLIKSGNKVIITGRNPGKLKEAQKQLSGVAAFQSDVRRPEQISQLYKEVITAFPDLNILINNAGIMRKIDLLEQLTPETPDIASEVDVNLSGTIRMVQQFLPVLMKQRSAAIINLSSGLAFIPFSIAPVYGATKAGIHSYTQALRVQLKDTRVKVFEVAPPATKTALNDPFSAQVKISQQMNLDKMVEIMLRGLKKDRYEIRPGLANTLKLMSRFAPKLGLNLLARPAKI